MVAIGRMLMSDPKVMLLDEPSVALSPGAVGPHGETRCLNCAGAAPPSCSSSTASMSPYAIATAFTS